MTQWLRPGVANTGSTGGSVVKNLPANAGDTGDEDLIPETGRSPREGNGNPLHYSCLGNPMDRGTWQAIVHRITESGTTEHVCIFHTNFGGFPGGASGKEPICQCQSPKRLRFDPWVRKIPWRRVWQSTPVFLPGEFHGLSRG